MPRFTFSQALTANQLGYNPLTGWQFETVPYPQGAAIGILVGCTDVNGRITVTSGSQTIQERSPIQSGATAGVMPAPLNTTPITFVAGFMDKVKLSIDEVAGGTPTVVGVVEIEPL
jgi:hypothetical protein